MFSCLKQLCSTMRNPILQAWTLAAVCVAAVSIIFFNRTPLNFAYFYFPDDAFFYNIIARNILAGLGPTSDGIAITNGFHPLWLGCVTLITAVFENALGAELLLQFIIAIAVFSCMAVYAARYLPRWICMGMIIVCSVSTSYLRILVSGMETGLAMLLLLTTLLLAARFFSDTADTKTKILLSLSLTLLLFARLDGGLFWIAFCVVFFLAEFKPPMAPGKKASAIAAIFAVPSLCAAAYFAYNYMTFGLGMPVSGYIKAYSLEQLLSADPIGYFERAYLKLCALYTDAFIQLLVERGARFFLAEKPASFQTPVFLTITGIIIFSLYSLRKGKILDKSLSVFIAYTLLHTFYYVFLQNDTYSLSWANGPELFLVSLSCAATAAQLFRRFSGSRNFRAAVLAILFILAARHNFYSRWNPETLLHDFAISTKDFNAAVQHIQDTVSENAVIASCNIGFLGYLSHRKTMSTDGLLNSYEYFRDYKTRNKTLDYLNRHGIKHIAEVIPKNREILAYLAERYPGLREADIKKLLVFTDEKETASDGRRYIFVLLR